MKVGKAILDLQSDRFTCSQPHAWCRGGAGERWYAFPGCAQPLLMQLFWTKWNRAER